MGTLVEVRACGPQEAVTQAVEGALDAVARVDRLMSFHDPESDLSRLNREAARAPQAVAPWTWIVLRHALRFSMASDGLFDVTVAPLLVREGLLPGEPGVAHAREGWRHVRLMPGRRVWFECPLQLDLGGIAKGFAVDLAVHALREGRCTLGMVNAGGDLRRFGTGTEPVHLRRGDGLVKAAELRCGAIATSAPLAAHADRLAQPLGSIFDPRSATPWKSGGAVMVAAPSCIAADALTKVAALAGPACEPLLARFGARAYWDSAGSQKQ
jgi:thiamine biosynthesis lipoprotein